MRIGRDAWVLGALTVSACATGAAMYFAGRASALEVVSFATGAVCVWLTVKESVWNFPVSLVNVALYFQRRYFGVSETVTSPPAMAEG